ncbi:protein transport protein sec31 [Mucor ambiguus]|uniref:Protein transport protein SEC31 n=1 Tax=Mucor ambiguus TaxID=91626 RepID=A0A0C9N7Z5_9FUNG|nr:protein transport protein sec31 [Mucor ambiguus]
MTRKLNTVRRTATFAWSPGHQAPMVATGTLAGALDESFSNASELEIFKLDLHPESNALDQTSYKVSTGSRFNTLAWGHATTEKPHGIIAGGMENGELELYDASAILDNKSSEDITILKNSTHTGTLKALDFNLFQTNLLASAGSNSEVYIWDLNNPTTPYTPGARSAKMDDISSVAWNCQVQHILSTSSTNGYTVVWDLRNKKEVMTLAYAGQNTLTGGRGSVSAIAWHPDVATQIVTASDDDQHPIISLWDLRHAHSPEKTLAGHSKGVLDVSWCRQDSDLLISSGKDCKTLCWNPNTGELNGELSSHSKWTFAADWCPRNPDLLATASFDGSIDVLSIQGTQTDPISSAAPVSDDPFEAALLSAAPTVKPFELKNPPKWLRRPVGASFGFSGKLVTFNNKSGHAAAAAAASTVPGQSAVVANPISRAVKMSTIETDPEIVKRSEQLESATESSSTVEALIEERIKAGNDQVDWEVLKTLFSEDAREQLMKYLGFEKEQLAAAANELLQKKQAADTGDNVVKEEPSKKVVEEEKDKKTDTEAEPETTPTEGSGAAEDASMPNDTASTLFGQSETDSPDDSFFGQVASEQASPVAATVNPMDQVAAAPLIEAVVSRPFTLYPDSNNDTDRLITRSIVLGDFESAVNVCLASEKYSDALLLAICGGSDLLARTQKTYFEHQSKKFAYLRLLEGIMEEDLNSIVRDADVREWSSILVVLCTFAQSKDFGPLCQVLGDRLLEQEDVALRENANLFYLAAGNLEKVSKIWIDAFESQESKDKDSVTYGARLQALIEKVTIFRKAIDYQDSALTEQEHSGSFPLADLYNKYCEYAEFMATQGKLDVALKYISLTPATFSADQSSISRGSVVRDRVYHANASQTRQYVKPSFPFEKKLLSSEQEAQYQQQPAARQNPYEKQQQPFNAYQPMKSASPAAALQQPTHYYAPAAATAAAPVSTQYSPYGQPNYNQQPAAATTNVGYNNYAPPAATANAYGQQAQAYAPSQQYGQPQFASPVVPVPHSNSSTPPPPPPKAAGAWNDPPMLPSPKMIKKASPVAGGPAKRVTTPFANAPPAATYAAGPPQQQQQQYATPPPPMNATPPPPMRGLGGPPPPPSSNTTAGYYSAHQQFQAPPHQQQQSFQAPPPPQKAAPPPPPPMNAVAPSPMLRGPPPQQQQRF